MTIPEVQPDSVVWVRPGNRLFANCLVTVEDVRDWGVQGYVQLPPGGSGYTVFHVRDNGRAYVRLPWEEIDYVGHMPADYVAREEAAIEEAAK